MSAEEGKQENVKDATMVVPTTPLKAAPAKATPATAPPTKSAPKSKGFLAAIRVRGEQGVRIDIRNALTALRLGRKHVCVLLADTPEVRGHLFKAKDFITFGTITAETKQLLESQRGVKGADGKLKGFFRLHPPRGGFERKGIKKTFAVGGALGDRKERMDALVKKML